MIDVSSSPEKHMRHQENTVPDGLIDKQEKREKPLLKIETQLKSVNSAWTQPNIHIGIINRNKTNCNMAQCDHQTAKAAI